MNRRSAILGLTAVALALPMGCGRQSASSQCRDGYVTLYRTAVKLLEDASPSDPDIDAKMTSVLGGGVPKACKEDPKLANSLLYQVEREFDSQLAALEGRWGKDTIGGFRDPLSAGHGEPIPHRSPGG